MYFSLKISSVIACRNLILKIVKSYYLWSTVLKYSSVAEDKTSSVLKACFYSDTVY